jgi:hypothetical protein
MLATIGATALLYVLGYLFGIGMNPGSHFGAVFASWVGGVALFVIAGGVVAIASVVRPEEGVIRLQSTHPLSSAEWAPYRLHRVSHQRGA